MSWKDDQKWEQNWWGTCQNTYNEESKQFVYASRMGLTRSWDGHSWHSFDVNGRILDIGGGPTSLLLKCPNATGVVADPCVYPEWVYKRYTAVGLQYNIAEGEKLDIQGYKPGEFDEVWFYNVLQHTIDPEKICRNARMLGKLVRVFEWIETGTAPGHPHNLTAVQLNAWLGGYGKTENINEGGCVGMCYYGIFLGDTYGKGED